MNHQVDYYKLINNMESMINLLEFDAMRSSGKAKLNSQHLHSLYFLVDKYKLRWPASLDPNQHQRKRRIVNNVSKRTFTRYG